MQQWICLGMGVIIGAALCYLALGIWLRRDAQRWW